MREAVMLDNIHTIIFDFDGVFTDNKVYVSETGLELVRCDRGDGLAINMLKKEIGDRDIDIFILSTETNPVVTMRAKKIGLPYIHGTSDKLACLKTRLTKRFGSIENKSQGIIYLGNDLNDFHIMQYVGYSYAPADAHKSIKKIATEVFTTTGGNGFVRDFVERKIILKQQLSALY
jgi:3-deoxy-D-manno-octulosonate 8-phosphate phosphatase (KDO 8-P phosphatase)